MWKCFWNWVSMIGFQDIKTPMILSNCVIVIVIVSLSCHCHCVIVIMIRNLIWISIWGIWNVPSGPLPYVPFINQRDPSSGFHRSNGSTKYMNSTYIAHSTEHIAHIYSTYSKVQVKHVTELISVVTCWHQDIIHHLCFHRVDQMLIFFDEFSILTSFGQIWRKYRVKYFRTCFTNFPGMRQEEAKDIFCRHIQNTNIWIFIPMYWIFKSKIEYSGMEEEKN